VQTRLPRSGAPPSAAPPRRATTPEALQRERRVRARALLFAPRAAGPRGLREGVNAGDDGVGALVANPSVRRPVPGGLQGTKRRRWR
jgi:hypothetical protein